MQDFHFLNVKYQKFVRIASITNRFFFLMNFRKEESKTKYKYERKDELEGQMDDWMNRMKKEGEK